MGGVREHRQISALSGWNQKVDLMLALLLQYSLTHDVVFHHAGYSFKSPEAAQDAVTLALEKYTRALRKPAEDHMRNYFAFSTDLSLPGKFWIEYQIWEKNLPRNGIHFDVATPDPLELLDYISSHSESEKVIWGDDGPNSPVGKVSALEADDLEIAIMARKEWTDVQDW